MKKNTQKGFTLVELLVVIAILAILASVAVVGYTAFIERADKQAADTEVAQIEALLDAALLTDGKVEIKKADNSYILITKAAGVITVTAPTSATTGATDLTAELGTLVSKLNVTDAKLTYTYKTGSESVDILP